MHQSGKTHFAILAAAFAIIVSSGPRVVLAASSTSISVVASDAPCPCGSHGGGFNALYEGKTIEVRFEHNPTPANPVAHPLAVFEGKNPVRDWSALLCSVGSDKCPVGGGRIGLRGRWNDKTTFDAYEIRVR